MSRHHHLFSLYASHRRICFYALGVGIVFLIGASFLFSPNLWKSVKAGAASSTANSAAIFVPAIGGCATPSFSAATNFGVGTNPFGVATGDFNRDGRPDLAVTNNDTDNVSVLLGNGAGSFGAAANFNAGDAPQSVQAGDFNRDGRDDLVVANVLSSNVSLLLGNGAGSFGAATNVSTGLGPNGVVAGDFNRDGNLDVATANFSANNVSVLLNNGSGGFAAAVNFSVGTQPREVVAGDFNLDGNLDLATANDSGNGVSVLLGNGAGSFGAATNFSAGNQPFSITSGDFNLDGRPDLAIGNLGFNNVSVLLGNGAGGFGAATNFPASSPLNVLAGDFNSDGKPDLAVTGGLALLVLPGNGAGSFGAATSFSTSAQASRAVTGDFNLDGKADLAASLNATTNIAVFLNSCNALPCGATGFGAATDFFAGTNPASVAKADFNRDGRLDLAVANFNSNNVSVLLGNGTGGFGAATNFNVGTNPQSVTTGDFNLDGRVDLVTANFNSEDVSVLLGNGTGGFGAAANFNVAGANPVWVEVSDFNLDGRPDLAVANLDFDSVTVRLGDGVGGFGALNDFGVGTSPGSVVAGDFNQDGQPDLATANINSGNVSVLLGLSGGSFGAATNFNVGSDPVSVKTADFNLDGRLDLVVANFASDNVSVLLGNGAGSFGAATNFNAGDDPLDVTVGDFNLDGKPDLAVANSVSNNVSVLLGNGAGSFGPVTNFNAGLSTSFVVSGDFNQDGSLDLAVANAGSVGRPQRKTGKNNASRDAKPAAKLAGESVAVLLNVCYAGAQTITVNTLADTVAVDGFCSLREAIMAANTAAQVNECPPGAGGLDVIQFNVGTGTPTINVTDPLPDITGGPLTINGNTGGATRIELNGMNMGAFSGLRVPAASAAGTTIRSLVINRFSNFGIEISVPNCTVQDCFIGTDATGTVDLGNTMAGINLSGSNAMIGGTAAGARNVISGNNTDGIILGGGATNNQVLGNYIGTNASGGGALGNTGQGINILSSANNNTIGGTVAAARNVISGNVSNGINIALGANNNLIQGNYIGPDSGGTSDLGNSQNGVRVVGATTINNVIGGTAAGARNFISGNNQNGVLFDSSNTTNRVEGNYIGLDINGAGLGNNNGVNIADATNITIGGTAAGAGNVISGNGGSGIFISAAGAGANTVQGNLIGTNPAGTAAIPNTFQGVAIQGANNTIGGTTAAARNVISGNGASGVALSAATSTGNVVQGNYIGTAANGTTALGNSGVGVSLGSGAANNTIGGTGAGAANTIAFSGGAGITLISAGIGNRIQTNSIFSNFGLGIDLGNNGVTTNDAGDADGGDNNLQNFPVLNFVTSGGFLSGSIDSTVANSAYPLRIEFFANTACDSSGNGEGEQFLGFASVAAPGAFTFSFAPVGGKPFITATATDNNGNTSEFSACRMVGDAPAQTIVVNTTTDAVAADGFCSLAEAIQAANTNAQVNECNAGVSGLDNIIFNVGSGTPTISIASPLPAITKAVTIDGATGGATRIEINGGNQGAGVDGLTITGGGSTIRNLVLNRFTGHGINISTAGGNTIQACLIGTNAAGTMAQANAGAGISVSSSNNIIGGATPSARNIISGNLNAGITVSSGFNIQIIGNYIGTNAAGNAALPNQVAGVLAGDNNFVGGTAAGEGNVISGNAGQGVSLGVNNVVRGNIIGLNAAGTAALGNSAEGVRTLNANNVIGGTVAGARNIISGNGGNGITIGSVAALNNQVLGNLIGTNTAGTAVFGNAAHGIEIFDSANNTVGGTTEASRNLISGNGGSGIHLLGDGATGNIVIGNFIGTDVNGTADLGNTLDGVTVEGADSNFIGGTTGTSPGGSCTGACNLVSGNNRAGVFMVGVLGNGAAGNSVLGNFVGTNLAGTLAIGNTGDGVAVQESASNTVGGTAAAARNLISGNGGSGAHILGTPAATFNNTVLGNFIGMDTTGASPLANALDGVRITAAANNTIGGTATGAGNFISGNGGSGVLIVQATAIGNRVLGNRINANGGLGIDLDPPGVTANDANDGDTGANNLQNFPVLSSAVIMGATASIQGTLNSAASAMFRIEFFSNPTCDASGNGEGQGYLGFTNVSTDASGNAAFSAELPVSLTFGQVVTATATDPAGNTSEFSPCGCTFTLTPAAAGFDFDGGNGTVGVATNSGCSWTAVSNTPAFITVTGGASGNGNGTVSYTVAANPATTPRTGSMTIAGFTFYVTQAAAGTILDEDFDEGIPPDWTAVDGGTGDVNWTTSNPCNADPGPPFDDNFVIVDLSCAPEGTIPDEYLITPPFDASGLGQVILQFDSQFRIAPGPLNLIGEVDVSTDGGQNWINVLHLENVNDGPNTRTVDITAVVSANPSNVRVRFHYFATVVRPARPGAPAVQEGSWIIDRPTLLALTVNLAMPVVPPAGGSQMAMVTAPAGVTWEVTSNAPWITPAVGGGTGSGPFGYVVAAYQGACSRTGTMTVEIPGGGQPPLLSVTATVTQTGAGLSITPLTLPNGFVSVHYNQSLTASGSAPPYTFTVSLGTLPPGLSLSSSGVLSGTPATAGTFNFTVKATDAQGCMGTQAYSLTIAGGSGLQFYPLSSPVRLLETRSGFSGCNNPGMPIAENSTFTLPARTACVGVPANAAAITGNITVVPSGAGYLTLFPGDAAQPTVANSNFGVGEITNNVFTVGLGASGPDAGAFKIFSSATTEVIIDVTGYYAPPSAAGLFFHPLATPVRLLETRTGFTGCFAPGTPLSGTGDPNADPNLDLALQGRSPIPSPCNSIPATAQVLVGNATSVLPSGGGYLTIYPSGGVRPTVASSNYAGGDVINGPFAVKLGADGKFKVYTFATTHLVIDILGYYSQDANDANGAGLFFNPLPSPVRLLETRPDFPGFPLTGCTRTNAKIQGNLSSATHTQSAGGFCGLPSTAQAVVGNVSVVNSEGMGFLTLFPGNLTTAPLVATSNYPAPATFGYNRHYFVGLSPVDGTFKVLTQFTTDLILDASGYFAP